MPSVMNRCSFGSDSSSVIVVAYGSLKTGIASGIRTPCLRKLIPALVCSSHSKPTTLVYARCVHTSKQALFLYSLSPYTNSACPAAIATYCLPSSRYVIGAAETAPPTLAFHSSAPVRASNA
jgi:hypothetical protein